MRVRLPDRRDPGWWRRRLPAAALVWSVVVALGVVPIGLGAGPQAVAESSTVTVQGPALFDPKNPGTPGKPGSITVSQTKDLTNQVVQVSWSGFTPTVDGVGNPRPTAHRSDATTFYAVRIYECQGANPNITDCYDSSLYGGDASAGFQQQAPKVTAPDFPSNMVIAPTGPDGSGAADIQLYTSDQSPHLGCDATHPCSLVVEANYGGDSLGATNPAHTVDCANHTVDKQRSRTTAADAVFNRVAMNGMSSGEQCAWANAKVIPLSFAPTPAACDSQAPAFVSEGLEMANRAIQKWRAGLCIGDSPLSFQYLSASGEPQARSRFLSGTTDVALTARPDTDPPARPYVYAPLATSGVSVVFLVDDPATGRQIRDMKLNARLLAKLLTQSYSPKGAVASVKGNPTCVFADPEFLALNPLPDSSGLKWPKFCNVNEFAPTVVGGTTDLVHQLTSWIAADPDAARFLDGEPDPWGMHIDTYYLRPAFSGYPVDTFIRQDSSGIDKPKPTNEEQHWREFEWNPVTSGLGDLVRRTLQNKPSCIQATLNGAGGHDACVPMEPGTRTLFSIMDTGQAKAYSLPEAQLLNPAGAYVSPSTTGFQAAVADMTVDASTGVQSLPYGTADTAYSRDQRTYPLTTVQYAMVPTQGVPADKAAAITRFLRTTTTSGQVYGNEPGHLAPGFLALTSAQRAQAADAATHVETQDAKLPGNQAAPPNPPAVTPADGGTAGGTSPTGPAGGAAPVSAAAGDSTTGGGSGEASTGGLGAGAAAAGGTGAAAAAAAGGKAPSASPSAPGKSLSAAPVAAGTPAADRSGAARLLLPVALIGGLVLLVGGPAALILGGTPAGERTLAGLRSGWSRLRRRP
ncbi:hypothetical protein ABTY61_25430 [Kitasatospora sp. NPDC096128]|uniref:hypothetical protein n=1 Tax=Kitasatospora sp. NPDC096128 TaxID=3155547 RepID=UPI00332E7640